MSLPPYVVDGLTIFVSVLLADIVLQHWHRIRKRAHMRRLNGLSQVERRRRRDVAKGGGAAP